MKKYLLACFVAIALTSFSQTASIHAGRVSAEDINITEDNFGQVPYEYEVRSSPDTLWVLSDSTFAVVKYRKLLLQNGSDKEGSIMYRDTIQLGNPDAIDMTSEEFRKSYPSNTVFVYKTADKKLNRKMNEAIRQNGFSGWWFLLIVGLLIGLHARERRRA